MILCSSVETWAKWAHERSLRVEIEIFRRLLCGWHPCLPFYQTPSHHSSKPMFCGVTTAIDHPRLQFPNQTWHFLNCYRMILRCHISCPRGCFLECNSDFLEVLLKIPLFRLACQLGPLLCSEHNNLQYFPFFLSCFRWQDDSVFICLSEFGWIFNYFIGPFLEV